MREALHLGDWKSKVQHSWRGVFVSVSLPLVAVALITSIIVVFHLHVHVATILLFYLFIVLWLAHTRGFNSAFFAAFIACLVFDFFLVEPAHSLNISQFEDAVGLIIFLLFCFTQAYYYSRAQRSREQATRQRNETSLLMEQKLLEEVKRRDLEMDTFMNVIRATGEEKDVNKLLQVVARSIKELLSTCGVQACDILVPNIDQTLLLHTLPSQRVKAGCALSPDEEASLSWVLEHGQSLILRNMPLIARPTGSYLRRTVASNSSQSASMTGYSYLAPLKSGEMVVGVLRLLIEEDAHPRLVVIKQILETARQPADMQAEPFSKLLEHAIFLIKQGLIEKALQQQECLREELVRQAEELHSAIIASVSHDFNTPLTLIIGAASSLLEQKAPCENEVALRHDLEAIIGEANWLQRILSRMLDLSRIEKGTLKLEKELYPIDGIILNTLDLGHMRSLVSRRKIMTEVPDDLPAVEVDPVLIGQVLMNLIENAIRYTPADSAIEIRAEVKSSQLLISVADSGPGIPRAELERIFEKFYRVKQEVEMGEKGQRLRPTAASPGGGIGLAVCRGFVEAHGGQIWAENRDCGGAKFEFTLPLPR